MRKIVLFVLLIAAFALSGCGNDDANDVNYESVGNVSFSVPSSWEADLSGSSDGVARFYPPDGMLIITTGLDLISDDIDAYVDGILENGGELVSDPEPFTVDGHDGYRFTASVPLEEQTQTVDVVAFDTSEGSVGIWMGTNTDSDADYTGDYQAVINSIIVDDSAPAEERTTTTAAPVSEYGEDLGGGDYSVKGIKDEVHPQSVRNDTTGSWKYCMIAQSGITAEDYAYNYYKTCFESGDTVHYVVNVSTNTTTCISDLGGLVAVTTTEYVDGEEHDASTLGGGMVLGSWNLYPDSGEMESTME